MLSREQKRRLHKRFLKLYGEEAHHLVKRVEHAIGRYGTGLEVGPASELWDHRTCVLITYADTLQAEGEAPLKTLRRFLRDRLKGSVSTIHLLPFFPWSSDDGFSVIDYRQVHPDYGTWGDVQAIGEDFELMFDLVLNHCSRKSAWFRDFVTGIAPARWYFLPMDPETDLSAVVRPRPRPLLTRTGTRDGPKHVWTTFSEDQVDLNWQNPDVFFEFLDILLFYLSRGCRIFRLDAVAFLWKRVGTNCLHLPETHEVIKTYRDLLGWVASDAVLLTETNVPHEENLAYFGDNDEAHMVYNFSLPPLLLHALLKEDPSLLRGWAASLPELSPEQSFFNFSASHDGIGVRPLQGLVEPEELDWLIAEVRQRGGRVSTKAESDGSESPYELNITYRAALADPSDPERGLTRFLLSQAVVLAFKGVPAVYIHSLLGTENDVEAVNSTGQNRAINRRKWEVGQVEALLDDPACSHARIFNKLTSWIRIRSRHVAFHPGAGMHLVDSAPGVFAFLRVSRTGVEQVLCLFNMTGREQSLPWQECFPRVKKRNSARELLSGKTVRPQSGTFTLQPFHAAWLLVSGGRSGNGTVRES